MGNETIEQLLGFEIRVLTNFGKEKIIRYKDFKSTKNSVLNTERGKDFCDFTKIEFSTECLGYALEFIDVEEGD